MPGDGPNNPFAPSAAVAAEVAPPARWPARLLAILTTYFTAVPFAGAGHVILGNNRRAARWAIAGVALTALVVLSVVFEWGLTFVAAAVMTVLVALASIVDTAVARASAPLRLPLALGLAALALPVGWLSAEAVRNRVKSFQVPSSNMAPVLVMGDHFMAAMGPHAGRGDIVVFAFPGDPSIDYVKRVVAIGGDSVEVKDDVVIVNGEPLSQRKLDVPCPVEVEPAGACTLREESAGDRRYLVAAASDARPSNMSTRRVPPGHLFVLGDNRHNSNDSRFWGFVPAANVRGRARVVYWSRLGGVGVRWDRIGRSVD